MHRQKRNSCFILPRIGLVGDRLDWTNVAICLQAISQVYRSLYV